MVILLLLVTRTFCQFVVLFSHFIASLPSGSVIICSKYPQPCQRMINHVSYPHCLLPWQLNARSVSVSRLPRYPTSFKFLLSLICLRFSLTHFLYCVIHAYAVSSYSSFFAPQFLLFYFCVSFNRDPDGRIIQWGFFFPPFASSHSGRIGRSPSPNEVGPTHEA